MRRALRLACIAALALACGGRGAAEGGSSSDGSEESNAASEASGSQSGAEADTGEADSTTTGTPTSSTTGCGAAAEERCFVPYDAPQTCGESCNVFDPLSCPEGEKCAPTICEVGSSTVDSHICQAIVGDGMLGDPCDVVEEMGEVDICDSGLFCVPSPSSSASGSCRALCAGSVDAPECAEGTTCTFDEDGLLPLCFPICHPLELESCAAGESCVPSAAGDAFVCRPRNPLDDAPYPAPCDTQTACDPGLLCIPGPEVPEPGCDADQGCCSPFCDIESTDACPGAGQVCVNYWPDTATPPPGYENIGVCRLPS